MAKVLSADAQKLRRLGLNRLKARAKKHGIKVTRKVGTKRVPKPDWMLAEQIANKENPKKRKTTRKKVKKAPIKNLSVSEAKTVARQLGKRGGKKKAKNEAMRKAKYSSKTTRRRKRK